MSEKLRNWFIKYRPSRECAQNLYKILQEENLNVENFYKTKNAIEPNIVAIAGGSYLAIGVATQLKKFSDYVALPEKLSLDVNIDGLPLFRSSKTKLWPVLLRLNNVYSCPVFPVGIYMGRSKPNSCNEYLGKFITELAHLISNGIEIGGKLFYLEIRAIICDAPARAFVSGTHSHTSKHGCSKCTQVAKRIDGVLTYSTKSGALITDADFANRKYSIHSAEFLNKKSPLEHLNLSMVTQIPLDLMHLIDLGVMRKFLLRIVNRKLRLKVSKENVGNISQKLLKIQKCVPKEFARKPRSLDDLSHWKATDFR